MKNRISSIMDTRRKRAGAIVLSFALIATLCTGFVLAANGDPERAYPTLLSDIFIFENGKLTPMQIEQGDTEAGDVEKYYEYTPFENVPFIGSNTNGNATVYDYNDSITRYFTEEEYARITADRENGKTQPFAFPDGIDVFIFDGGKLVKIND